MSSYTALHTKAAPCCLQETLLLCALLLSVVVPALLRFCDWLCGRAPIHDNYICRVQRVQRQVTQNWILLLTALSFASNPTWATLPYAWCKSVADWLINRGRGTHTKGEGACVYVQGKQKRRFLCCVYLLYENVCAWVARTL